MRFSTPILPADAAPHGGEPARAAAQASPGSADGSVSAHSLVLALNPEQLAAVQHSGGPLLVLAGAGTGKTATLAARVAQRVIAGADPHRLLLLTFSRRAAHTLAQRAGQQVHRALGWPVDRPAPGLPWAGTFHGIAARLLRQAAPDVGLDAGFTILDRGDAEALMGLARDRLGLAESRGRRRFPLPSTALAILSRCVNTQVPLAEVLTLHYPWCQSHSADLQRLFAAYTADKAAQATLDYDDLLLAWWQLMQDAGWAAHLGSRFDEVLVDEYQDVNHLQAGILRRLKPDGQGLTVVGDDAQSIYAFRGAAVTHILGFAACFEPAARTVRLSRNYRSSQAILDAADAVLAGSTEHQAKGLLAAGRHASVGGQRPRLVVVLDELAQARQVADTALQRREQGLRLTQQAVLFRTGHHSAALELELTRREIPFVKFGGLKFLEAAHLKDVLAVLRWSQNPRDALAAFRALQLLPGVGPATARQVVEATANAPEPWLVLRSTAPPEDASRHWPGLLALMDRLTRPAAEAPPWPAALADTLDWYAPLLERRHPETAEVRQGDLDQLLAIARSHRNRERFLAELTLDPPEATSDRAGPPHRDEDYLILSTLHAAKGQEWESVSILNVVDGCLPADLSTGELRQIEEERRLLYVGMTRARQHLDLLVPQRFHVGQQHRQGDRHLYGGPSRFLSPQVMQQLDRVALDALDPTDGAGAGGAIGVPVDVTIGAAIGAAAQPEAGRLAGRAAPPRIDLAARLRQQWDDT